MDKPIEMQGCSCDAPDRSKGPKMTYRLLPLKGANLIEFGMTVAQARSLVKSTPKEFRRSDEVTPSDFFADENLFFYYDKDGHLKAIEFARGAHVLLGDESIFKMNFEQFLSFLRAFDPETVADDEGATSHRLSLGVWVPFMAEDDGDDEEDADEVGQIESILIGRPGYFESEDMP